MSIRTLFQKKVAFIRSHPRLDIAFLVIALAVFVTITFLNADRATAWFDEAFSSYITQFSFFDIARYTAVDVHPPFYYWVLKVWEMLFGTSVVALRSMSIFFGVVVISLSFLLTRRLFGRLSAGVALLFLTLSPMLIRYSDEARMYTLATTIVLLATFVLLKATASNKRRYWVIYGILVGLGMWTHYFTALAWLAHWVWRVVMTKRKATAKSDFWQKFLSKDWVIAHIVAVGTFLPWLPFMALQLGGIQGNGFWIPPVSPDSPVNFLTSIFYYLEHGKVLGWWALGLVVVVIALIILLRPTFKALNRKEKDNYLLIAALAFAPPVLLFIASLPPLKSSFVERYLLPAVVAFCIFLAVTIVVGSRKWRLRYRIGLVAVIAGMMVFGISNVYFYGNYNKNSNQHILTHEVIEQIDAKAKPGEPIIANSPWVFYEAVVYSTAEHPVYFIDKDVEYIFGSLDMLKYNDMHKITDLDAFTKEHPVVWYIGSSGGDLDPPETSWKRIQNVSATSWVDGATLYRASQFEIN